MMLSSKWAAWNVFRHEEEEEEEDAWRGGRIVDI